MSYRHFVIAGSCIRVLAGHKKSFTLRLGSGRTEGQIELLVNSVDAEALEPRVHLVQRPASVVSPKFATKVCRHSGQAGGS